MYVWFGTIFSEIITYNLRHYSVKQTQAYLTDEDTDEETNVNYEDKK